jgi:hypothetical protein
VLSGGCAGLALQEDEEVEDGKWVDGHFQRPTQKWAKWKKMTERTTQLDVGTASNEYFSQMLQKRAVVPEGKYNADYKDFCHEMSEENRQAKPPRPDVSDLIPADKDVYIYSSQSLNVAELQKEAIRRKLDQPENDDKFYTYSDEYMSLAMCKVNEEEIARLEAEASKRRWVDPKGWVYPAPKPPESFNQVRARAPLMMMMMMMMVTMMMMMMMMVMVMVMVMMMNDHDDDDDDGGTVRSIRSSCPRRSARACASRGWRTCCAPSPSPATWLSSLGSSSGPTSPRRGSSSRRTRSSSPRCSRPLRWGSRPRRPRSCSRRSARPRRSSGAPSWWWTSPTATRACTLSLAGSSLPAPRDTAEIIGAPTARPVIRGWRADSVWPAAACVVSAISGGRCGSKCIHWSATKTC